MKWPTIATICVTLVQLFWPLVQGKPTTTAGLTCNTYYRTTSPKSVITTTTYTETAVVTGTTTVTITFATTTTAYPSTARPTKTTTKTFTYYTTTAPTTITVPTPAHFTPAVSAKNASAEPTFRRRVRKSSRNKARRLGIVHRALANAASPAPASVTSYEYEVRCTKNYTLYNIDPIGTDISTTVIVSATTVETISSTTTIHKKTTSTIHQATATMFVACIPANGNVIHRFDQHDVDDILPLEATTYTECNYHAYDYPGTRAARQSPEDCCHSVFARNQSFAFFYHGTPGISGVCSCLHLDSGTPLNDYRYDWQFYTAESGTVDPPVYVGNGAYGKPYFGGHSGAYTYF